jgi:hypothetical protein
MLINFLSYPDTVANPDPDWIRIQWGPCIRNQEGKNDAQKWEKVNKFHFLAGCSLLRADGLFL